MYSSNISKISKIEFGLLSSKDIRTNSVSEVSKMSYFENNTPVKNGLFDSRMGTLTQNDVCETDLLSSNKSPGYYGNIELNLPVYNHFHIEKIVKTLSVICIKCGNLLNPLIGDIHGPSADDILNMSQTNQNYPSYESIMKIPSHKRLQLLSKILLDKNSAPVCKYCNTKQPSKYILNCQGIVDSIGYPNTNFKDEKDKLIILYPEYVFRLFEKITKRNCEVLGYDYKKSNPSSLILHTIPVCPPVCRPFNNQGNNMISHDHLTLRYEDVLKTNELVKSALSTSNEATREKVREFLAHDVSTVFNNDPGNGFIAKGSGVMEHQTFAQRIKGKIPKTGRIRGNLMSTRVEMSARSVITPDPMIDLDEIGVPEYIAKKLTFPEKVTSLNKSFLYKCIENGPDVYPGCVGIEKSGKIIKPKQKEIILEDGDIVIRHLCNGDYVLMNRAPTLHKKSMMSHRVRIFSGYSFRLNVNVTEPYNADFDGDEMNLHCPQSISSLSELTILSNLNKQCMNSASNEPAIPFVQDNVLCSRLMSESKKDISQQKAMNMLAFGSPYYYGSLDKRKYSGIDILNFYTPEFYSKDLGKINKGVLKDMIQECYQEQGESDCFKMISTMQKLFGAYLNNNYFSIGPKDLKRSKEIHSKIDGDVDKMIENIINRLEQIHSGKESNSEELFEKFISDENRKIDDNSEKLLGKNEDSRFKTMIESKSKGKNKNIKQMKGFLGQQIVNGKRTNTGYTERTLPHFNRYSENIETKGFIRSSFSKGLHPYEFYFHAGGGREGLIEQALQTGQTGYIQRQMIKFLEDITIHWNNTVSDCQGNILQFLYGDDSTCGENIESINLNEIISYSIDELEIMYSLTANKTDWIECIESNIINTNKQNDDLFVKFFNELLEMREFIANMVLPYTNTINCNFCMNIERKINKICNKYNLIKNIKTNLDPTTILKSYNELFDKCSMNKISDFTGIYMLKFLIYSYASPKSLICNYRFTRESFEDFLNDVEKSFKYSRIEAGETVGVLSAQSLGEPCTQLTLNSFHFAGAGRSQGLPRIQELLYLESKKDLAMTKIYLDAPHCYLKNDAIAIAKDLSKVFMKDVIVSYKFYYDDRKYRDPILRNYQKLEKESQLGQSSSSPWILKLYLDNSKVELTDIWYAINNFNYFSNPILESDNKTITFRIDIYNVKNISNNRNIIVKESLFEVNQIVDIIEHGIEKVIVTGIENISSVDVVESEIHNYNNILGSIETEEVFNLITSGTNLLEILSYEGINSNLTYSNNILETLEVFGIESARQLLINELYETLKDVGSIDKRHISILSDRMTQMGILLPCSSKGNEEFSNGPLGKASFEKVLYELDKASTSAYVDNIEGISANIMVGQVPPCGTGIVNVKLDDSIFSIGNKKFNKNIGEVKKEKKSDIYETKMDNDIRFDID
tara:strand:+ start:3327 stop:7598 length:4272 start_codon:yes stop_codon:yes gene_type:complete